MCSSALDHDILKQIVAVVVVVVVVFLSAKVNKPNRIKIARAEGRYITLAKY